MMDCLGDEWCVLPTACEAHEAFLSTVLRCMVEGTDVDLSRR